MSRKPPYILFHLTGWIAFIAFQLVIFPHPERFLGNKEIYPYLVDQLLINGLCIFFFYLHYLWLIPRYYFNHKTLHYLFFLALSVVLCLGLVMFFHKEPPPAIPTNMQGIPEFSENPLAPPALPATQKTLLTDHLLLAGNFSIKFILAFLLSLGIRIYQRWQHAEEERYKAELSFLKAQIHPHFLFNTLNGIYSMAVKKSDQTASAIIKLSSIMRYVFYEGHHSYVDLENELSYIRNYIELQQMRLSPNIRTEIGIDTPQQPYRIAPLLLIPFIENTFKYGISTERDCLIRIAIKVEDDVLTLETYNLKFPLQSASGERSGIGLENTKARLKKLYPSRYTLDIRETDQEFMVILKLQLL